MIRSTTPQDTLTLVALTEATAMFKPLEIQALREVLDDYHAANHAHGHRAVTWDAGGEIQGFAYYAPAAMTDRTWYVYWIAVRKTKQGSGIGGQMLKFLEADVRARQGRVLFIETGSLPLYELTRAFYRKHGYEQHAVLADYYSDGDSMVVFRKKMT